MFIVPGIISQIKSFTETHLFRVETVCTAPIAVKLDSYSPQIRGAHDALRTYFRGIINEKPYDRLYGAEVKREGHAIRVWLEHEQEGSLDILVMPYVTFWKKDKNSPTHENNFWETNLRDNPSINTVNLIIRNRCDMKRGPSTPIMERPAMKRFLAAQLG